MDFRSRGLIIGIASYKSINKLPNAVINDATDIYEILTDASLGGYCKDDIELLTDYRASKSNICAALQKLSEASKDDSVLIYFSGHGGQIISGSHKGDYLLPVDTDFSTEQALADSAISGNSFTKLIRAIPAKRLVVIFDCCHSGGIGTPKDPSAPILKAGLPERYFEELLSERGRVIIASSRSSEVSFILPDNRNSLFTKHLKNGLYGDAPGIGGVIRIFDLFHYLQPKVTAEEPNQHPIFKAEIEENFPISLYKGGKSVEITPFKAPSDDYKYDVFISYRQTEPDKTWTRKVLLPELEAKGLNVCIDFKSFRLGPPLIIQMERAVEESRYTLAVLTPAYLESSFTEFENVMADHLGLEQSNHRFISILKEECKPSLRIRARMWLDMTDEAELSANVERLVYEIKQPPYQS